MKELKEIFVRGIYNIFDLDSPYSRKEYGPNWTNKRLKCLQRDGRKCRICNKKEDNKEHHVHHINPRTNFKKSNWKEMNSLSNLITLCNSCHGKYEGKYIDCNHIEFEKRIKSNKT